MIEEYTRDMGKTIPSFEGKWDKNKEFERLSIVYVEDGEEQNDINNQNNNQENNNNQNNQNNNQNNNNNNNNNNNENNNQGNNSGNENSQQTEYVNVSVGNTQGAKIYINGQERNTSSVLKGSNVTITLKKDGYRDKSITLNNIQSDYSETLSFTDDDKIKLIVRLNINGDYDTSYINGYSGTELEINYGDDVAIEVTKEGYEPKQEFIENVTNDLNVQIEFTSEDLLPDFLISKDGINWVRTIHEPLSFVKGSTLKYYIRTETDEDITDQRGSYPVPQANDNTNGDISYFLSNNKEGGYRTVSVVVSGNAHVITGNVAFYLGIWSVDYPTLNKHVEIYIDVD